MLGGVDTMGIGDFRKLDIKPFHISKVLEMTKWKVCQVQLFYCTPFEGGILARFPADPVWGTASL